MIVKTAIKYKLLEWALDVFISKIFSAFDVTKSVDKIRPGQKFKELHISDIVFYHVTVTEKLTVSEDYLYGYNFVYKYVNYHNSDQIIYEKDGETKVTQVDEFLDSMLFKNIDILDDTLLFLSDGDLKEARFIEY